jgi:hypothetical protein
MLRMRDHGTFRNVFEAALAARPEFIHHSRKRMFRSDTPLAAMLAKAHERETCAETVS